MANPLTMTERRYSTLIPSQAKRLPHNLAGNGHAGAAVALVQDKVTKESPELVEAVLQRYASG